MASLPLVVLEATVTRQWMGLLTFQMVESRGSPVQVILGEKPTPPQQPQFRCGLQNGEDGKQD